MTSNKRVVLGFSGGLDTTFCVKYLTEDQGHEVHTVTVNTGGFSTAELAEIEKRAQELGVATHTAIEATGSYYRRIIRYLIFGNILKNQTYPLSVSAERLSQAIHLVEHARKIEATAIAHGSTGAGNDQVRFDMIVQTLMPEAELITPIRALSLTREQEVEYLKGKGITYAFEKAQYSINKGLWGTSIGGAETLKSMGDFPEEVWPTQRSRTEPREVTLSFKEGELSAVDGKGYENPVDAIQELNRMGSEYAIGRDIHVGDTIIGIKGRVAFEAPAAMMVIKAHHALEKHVLTKWQLQWKETLSSFYGNWLHEGQILDPVMRDIESFLESSQERVTGTVRLRLHPYRFTVVGVESPYDLMQSAFGSYGEVNAAWSGDDVKGFTKLFGLQTAIYHQTNGDSARADQKVAGETKGDHE